MIIRDWGSRFATLHDQCMSPTPASFPFFPWFPGSASSNATWTHDGQLKMAPHFYQTSSRLLCDSVVAVDGPGIAGERKWYWYKWRVLISFWNRWWHSNMTRSSTLLHLSLPLRFINEQTHWLRLMSNEQARARVHVVHTYSQMRWNSVKFFAPNLTLQYS